MPNWVIGLIGIFGVIIGAAITFLTNWWERKERYQVLTFPKRLEVHQQALSLCMEIRALLIILPPADKEKADALSELGDKAGEWWKNNLLYLDERSRIAMSDGIKLAWNVASQAQFVANMAQIKQWTHDTSDAKEDSNFDKDKASAITKLDYATDCIVKGIGAKYLPELEKSEDRKRR